MYVYIAILPEVYLTTVLRLSLFHIETGVVTGKGKDNIDRGD